MSSLKANLQLNKLGIKYCISNTEILFYNLYKKKKQSMILNRLQYIFGFFISLYLRLPAKIRFFAYPNFIQSGQQRKKEKEKTNKHEN